MAVNPVTIMDLAKLLNLSKSTVSRALKNHPDISQATRDAVRQLADALNYRPNSVAVTLRHKKSRIIGLVVPQISYFFFPSVVKGIEDEVNKHGYTLMIMQSNEEYTREKEACNHLMSGNVEGILISVSRETVDFHHFEEIIDSGLPMVFFDRVPETYLADMVLVDDTDGAYRAVKHLIETGKRKIAICTGTPNLLISRNRLKGYKQAHPNMIFLFTNNTFLKERVLKKLKKRWVSCLTYPIGRMAFSPSVILPWQALCRLFIAAGSGFLMISG